MINKTIIYGASDDLIEIEGEVEDELDYGKNSATITCSDGTIAKIGYNGTWDIKVLEEGTLFKQLVKAVKDGQKHDSPLLRECSSYSDVLVLETGIEWVKIGKRKFKRFVAK